jgi:hypothetical protein
MDFKREGKSVDGYSGDGLEFSKVSIFIRDEAYNAIIIQNSLSC